MIPLPILPDAMELFPGILAGFRRTQEPFLRRSADTWARRFHATPPGLPGLARIRPAPFSSCFSSLTKSGELLPSTSSNTRLLGKPLGFFGEHASRPIRAGSAVSLDAFALPWICLSGKLPNKMFQTISVCTRMAERARTRHSLKSDFLSVMSHESCQSQHPNTRDFPDGN
jgi:hypothetical protein